MNNQIDKNGVMQIKQEGFFYSVSGNDALILNKYLNYKLYGINIYKTGFPVAGKNTVLDKINLLDMNYDILDKNKVIILEKRFPNNKYEIIDPFTSTEIELPHKTGKITNSKNPSKNKEKKNKLDTFIYILEGLSEGINAITGEVLENFDNELKTYCFEMALFFDNKLKQQKQRKENNPRMGQSWTNEEDESLILEYKSGKSIDEIALLHERSNSSIQSRLLKLSLIDF